MTFDCGDGQMHCGDNQECDPEGKTGKHKYGRCRCSDDSYEVNAGGLCRGQSLAVRSGWAPVQGPPRRRCSGVAPGTTRRWPYLSSFRALPTGCMLQGS